MATSASDPFTEMMEQQAQAMKAFQEASAESAKAWQAFSQPAGDRGAGQWPMPDPTDVVATYFRFAEQVLHQQHEYALAVIKAMKAAQSSTS